jgi:hypothetical protein
MNGFRMIARPTRCSGARIASRICCPKYSFVFISFFSCLYFASDLYVSHDDEMTDRRREAGRFLAQLFSVEGLNGAWNRDRPIRSSRGEIEKPMGGPARIP